MSLSHIVYPLTRRIPNWSMAYTSCMCQTLCVRQRADHPRKIGNPKCRINHQATKVIALGPGKIRPSIFFLFIVFIAGNYQIVSGNLSNLTKCMFTLRPTKSLTL